MVKLSYIMIDNGEIWCKLIMVEVPAVGKAGNFLDWIAEGLGMNELKDFGNPCPL